MDVRLERSPLWLLGMVVLVLGSAAAAQRAPLAFASLPWPAQAHAILEHGYSHGCSRSYASAHRRATLELSVDAAGVARLVLDGRSDETAGSRGGGGASHTFHLHRVELSGVGQRTGSTLSLHFTQLESGSAWYEGYGTAPPPSLTTASTELWLSCAVSAEAVLPAEWSEQEAPVAERLLRCELAGGSLPDAFDYYGAPPFVFGNGEAVRTLTESGAYARREGTELRRVP